MSEKTLHNTTASQAKDNVSDLKIWGEPDCWKLICKASSESEGWMKSTKAMQLNQHNWSDVLVQVTTQQKNPDGSYSIAEALTVVQSALIEEVYDKPEDDENKVLIARKIVQY